MASSPSSKSRSVSSKDVVAPVKELSLRRGRAVVIVNDSFTHPADSLPGAMADVEPLSTALEALGFHVSRGVDCGLVNLSARAIVTTLCAMATEEDFSGYDGVVVVLSTLGGPLFVCVVRLVVCDGEGHDTARHSAVQYSAIPCTVCPCAVQSIGHCSCDVDWWLGMMSRVNQLCGVW